MLTWKRNYFAQHIHNTHALTTPVVAVVDTYTKMPPRTRSGASSPAGFFERHSNVYLYVPNLIGYTRVVLAAVSLAYAFDNMQLSLCAYFLSFVCDELDGRFARKFNQWQGGRGEGEGEGEGGCGERSNAREGGEGGHGLSKSTPIFFPSIF